MENGYPFLEDGERVRATMLEDSVRLGGVGSERLEAETELVSPCCGVLPDAEPRDRDLMEAATCPKCYGSLRDWIVAHMIRHRKEHELTSPGFRWNWWEHAQCLRRENLLRKFRFGRWVCWLRDKITVRIFSGLLATKL